MPGYIMLGKYTQSGLVDIKDLEADLQKTKDALKELGIRFVGYWLTMGEYDFVGIADAPDDHAIAVLALMLGKSGACVTQTMRAFSEKEAAEIVRRLP